MNKLIRDLMPKPWVFPYPDREMYSKEQMEHFSLLIVGECIHVIKEQAGLCLKSNASEDELKEIDLKVKALLASQTAIARHFGSGQ
jgi:hypothetical protein